MAKLLKLDLSENQDLEAVFDEIEAFPIAPSNPMWERLKHDTRWQTDRWLISDPTKPRFKRSPRRGGSR